MTAYECMLIGGIKTSSLVLLRSGDYFIQEENEDVRKGFYQS